MLPNQNQLYAYYISRCGHHRVGKPNRHVLRLLTEDEPSRLARLSAESKERGVSVQELVEMENGASGTAVDTVSRTILPLAQRTTVRLEGTALPCGGPPGGPASAVAASGSGITAGDVVVGARGMMPVLDLIACLPLLEELDLSNVSSWFTSDASAAIAGDSGISGNTAVSRLCEVIQQLPALRKVDISSQPIGSRAAEQLLRAVLLAPRLTEVRIAREGVHDSLYYKLRAALERNAALAPTLPPPPALPAQLPEHLASLPVLDRKTLREQQLLRSMLAADVNFAAVLTADELSALVLHARVMSTQEVATRCDGQGLRGDGVHLFVIKSGAMRAFTDLIGMVLRQGDYFGDTYQDEIVFPSFRVVQEERGVVYALPLQFCSTLLKAWGARVKNLYAGFVSKAPLLQPLDAWTRTRFCTCCREVRTYSPAEVAVQPGEAERSLWLLLGSGGFCALPGTEEDKVITGRYEPYPFDRLDVFGAEALVSARKASSVKIVADKDATRDYRCAIITGVAIHLVQDALWSVLVASVSPYSLHEDLRRVAVKEPEWVYCI